MSTHFTCTGCEVTKPSEDFGKCARTPKGYKNRCKECINGTHRAWRKGIDSKEYDRASNLKRNYSIDIATYDAMLEEQGGVCAICEQGETTVRKGTIARLAVDHCHSTGNIRGLLCNSCNRALGKFKDSVFNLTNAIKYLENNI